MGGEPVKVLLLKEQFPIGASAASILSVKLAESLARVSFISLGMGLAFSLVRVGPLPLGGLLLGFTLTTAGVVAFLVLQVHGMAAPVRNLAARFHWLRRSSAMVEDALEQVDEHLGDLYGSRSADFAASVLMSWAALCVGVFQVWLIMGWLGIGRDWHSALAIEAFTILVNFVLFIVPGSVGVQEGSNLLIFTALALPVSPGLTLGLAFRIISVAIVAAGFMVLTWIAPRGGLATMRGATGLQFADSAELQEIQS